MVNLSKNLSKIVSKQLGLNLKEEFSEDELSKINILELMQEDIVYLDYFKNVNELIFSQFPSITEDNIKEVASKIQNLEILRIREQSALKDIDLSNFKNLKALELAYNDNLVSIRGISSLNNFILYDNKEYIDTQQIVDIIDKTKNGDLKLDIVYYPMILRYLVDNNRDKGILKKISWVEAVGLRKHIVHEYEEDEVNDLINIITAIISKYLFVTDGDIEKFGVLYYWMINNITFVNEDDPKSNVNDVSYAYLVFSKKCGGRLSFAKAFQLLLAFAKVSSYVVYSVGALETIGYYNGKKVSSLLGTSDYALLRVMIDNRYYYSDIAWDSLAWTYNYFDELRLFLVSKDELKLRHKLIGESNIINSNSYHGDDSDDLIMFAEDRIKMISEVFNDIERFGPLIVGTELNIAILNKKISELKNQSNGEDGNDSSNKLKDYQNELSEVEIELVKLNKQRKSVIDSYASFLREHYLGFESINMELDEVIEIINTRKEILLISPYMDNILQEVIKAT